MKKEKKLSGQRLKIVLNTPLVDLGVRELTLWVTRPERDKKAVLKRLDKEGVGADHRQEIVSDLDAKINGHPRTVGDFIAVFRYRLQTKPVHSWKDQESSSVRLRDRLGKGTVTQIMQKFKELGITPDIWPALIPKADFLKVLSKEVIMELPVTEALIWRGNTGDIIFHIGCGHDEFAQQRMADFLRNDPRNYPPFLKVHRRYLTWIHQMLSRRGFTKKDGAFFDWKPQDESLLKVEELLESKYGLKGNSLTRFAWIVVQERWVI